MRRLEPVTGKSPLVIAAAVEKIERLQRAIETVIKGKPEAVRLGIVALLAGGHLLIEDVPGVGKTTLAHALARALHCNFQRTDGSMPHIDLARWADTVVIAPATADVMARFALGLADDLLTTLFLALEPTKRVIVVPAMNTVMWNKPVVQSHVATLRAAGATILLPVEGNLACGEQGIGAMAEPDVIAGAIG